MTAYLLNIIQPDGDPPPPDELASIMAELDALNAEIKAAGAWVFAVGLHPASAATVVRSGRDALVTDGPYVEGAEHIGGFTIISADDLDAALRWADRLSAVLTLPIEVRPVAWLS